MKPLLEPAARKYLQEPRLLPACLRPHRRGGPSSEEEADLQLAPDTRVFCFRRVEGGSDVTVAVSKGGVDNEALET